MHLDSEGWCRVSQIQETAIRDRSWIVAQIGARQHFTVPAGFEELGRLERLYTDMWCRYGSGVVGLMGGKAKDLAGRFSAAIPGRKVVSFTRQSLWSSLAGTKRQTLDSRYQRYIDKGREFALAVNRHLKSRLRNPERLAYFAFNTGCLETIRLLRELDVPTVVDQIDPARVEERIVLEEAERWPGWEAAPGRIPECYFERLESEWHESDVVFVNSNWCRDALIEQGVADEKIAVAPIAFGGAEKSGRVGAIQGKEQRPLRVLWLGQVNLRKGIPYLMEAARLLAREGVEFRVVGRVSISESARKSVPTNMRIEGPVARVDAAEVYRWADVFVLPTLSDGFAITQLEAMSHSLPVITTPNCGEVVTDGEEGFIVPIRDGEALAGAISKLAEDRELLATMSERARLKVREFSVERVAQRRLDVICDAFERVACGV